MKIALLACFLVLYNARVDAQRQCTEADLETCEQMLTEYTRNPDNWSEEHKSIFYCEFVQMRFDCLENLDCDHTRNIEGMPINIEGWLNLIRPGLGEMRAYGLCDATESTIEVDYDNPCDEYYLYKNCSEYISSYLKSRFALTCSAMLKASHCFIEGRKRCNIPMNHKKEFVSPYITIAVNRKCVLIHDPKDPVFQKQEKYRIDNGLGYFAFS
ncbi:uncharacterized protein [Ptychodera flava]